ncbi:MAG: hypothetical protein ABI432_18745 [Flavobacteriales bacterium]
MLRTLSPLIAIACASGLCAQNMTERATVAWGGEFNTDKDGAFDAVIGSTATHVYLALYRKKELFIEKMDFSLAVVYKKLVPLEIGKDDHELEKVVVFGDRILVFTTSYDGKANTNGLFLRIFSAEDMVQQGAMQRLASIDAESKRDKGGFEISFSPDEKIVLVSQNVPYEKDTKERFDLKIFDMNMALMWQREVELPYLDSEFGVQDLRVDNDGSVIMVGNKYAEKREARELRKDGKATYTYHLLVYRSGTGSPSDHAIEVADKFLQDLTLSLGDDGDILCGGFFSNKGTFSIRGTFFLKLDRTTKAIIHESYKEFDNDFITKYMTEKEERKATKQAERHGEDMELVDFELREIVRSTDGGAVMIGEQYDYYVTHTSYMNANGTTSYTTSYHYVYNDIIAVSIDPDGNIAWAVKVPKRQHTVNDRGFYSSFGMTVKGERIYLVFNDNGKNLFLPPAIRWNGPIWAGKSPSSPWPPSISRAPRTGRPCLHPTSAMRSPHPGGASNWRMTACSSSLRESGNTVSG